MGAQMTGRTPTRATLASLFGGGFALIATLVGLAYVWSETGLGMPGRGWLALCFGAVLTLAVALGLFFLVFYSARQGFDDIDRPDDRSSP
jgi:hypothetical protein